jgi:hypothetical protein
MMAFLVAAGAGLLLIVSGLTDVGLFGSAAVAATLLVFGPWLFTRDPDPRALGAGSVVALTLAGVSVGVDGPTWQLMPWIALAAGSVRRAVTGHGGPVDESCAAPCGRSEDSPLLA